MALVGPTATGKSELAFRLAKALGNVEIISADSMQVYRGMDIGTAKPGTAERAEVPHHMLDLADPSEDWDLARFVAVARDVLADVESRGRRALLVGGTGLYVQALVDDFSVPGQWPEVHQALSAQADTAALYRQLCELDPEGAAKIEPGNRRRVLRALEVTLGGGRPFSSYGPGVGHFPATRWRLAAIWLPRRVVSARVEDRFEKMLAGGLVDEVQALCQRPGGLSRTARQALGYREILSHLERGAPLAQAAAEAVRRTRRFARRQRMWWRRDPRLRWFGAVQDPLELLPALLGDWERD